MCFGASYVQRVVLFPSVSLYSFHRIIDKNELSGADLLDLGSSNSNINTNI